LASVAGAAGPARPSTSAGRPGTSGLRPGTGLSRPSTGQSQEQFGVVGASATGGSKLPDPPLQRPKRAHYRKADKVQARDVLLSHADQIARKAASLRVERDAEADQFVTDLHRLRSEMEAELEDKVHRRMHMRDVALIHQVQAHEKALRDREARALEGTTYFPFRTEEEVQAQNRRSNAILRSNLDQQMRERAAARLSLSRPGSSRPGTPESTGLLVPGVVKELQQQREAAAAHDATVDLEGRPHVALQAAIEEAYDVRAQAAASARLGRGACRPRGLAGWRRAPLHPPTPSRGASAPPNGSPRDHRMP